MKFNKSQMTLEHSDRPTVSPQEVSPSFDEIVSCLDEEHEQDPDYTELSIIIPIVVASIYFYPENPTGIVKVPENVKLLAEKRLKTIIKNGLKNWEKEQEFMDLEDEINPDSVRDL